MVTIPQTSPIPSPSLSSWSGLAMVGQLSLQSFIPSPSESLSGLPQPHMPGFILVGSLGQPSSQSRAPSPSASSSSTAPSQSLSILSQTSMLWVPGVALHTVLNPSDAQIFVPIVSQAPIPVLQTIPISKPSSIAPLQLLSFPSQSSFAPGLIVELLSLQSTGPHEPPSTAQPSLSSSV